jgi:tetratricopeptide (TPR) repeat protein
LSNRAAARLKVGDAEAALEDASAALRSDPGHDKARRRRAQARVELGDLRGALGDLEALHSRLPLNAKVAADLADVRRSVAHADGETLAEMDRHDEERAAIAESREAAWEAKREAGLRAHRQRAMSARASRTAVKPR